VVKGKAKDKTQGIILISADQSNYKTARDGIIFIG
jgi:hypothetical protein